MPDFGIQETGFVYEGKRHYDLIRTGRYAMVSSAAARVYVNTPKDFDVIVKYTPILNVAVTDNKTVIVTFVSVNNNVGLGLGSGKEYKNFIYTILK